MVYLHPIIRSPNHVLLEPHYTQHVPPRFIHRPHSQYHVPPAASALLSNGSPASQSVMASGGISASMKKGRGLFYMYINMMVMPAHSASCSQHHITVYIQSPTPISKLCLSVSTLPSPQPTARRRSESPAIFSLGNEQQRRRRYPVSWFIAVGGTGMEEPIGPEYEREHTSVATICVGYSVRSSCSR
jgi:hypothetical protein